MTKPKWKLFWLLLRPQCFIVMITNKDIFIRLFFVYLISRVEIMIHWSIFVPYFPHSFLHYTLYQGQVFMTTICTSEGCWNYHSQRSTLNKIITSRYFLHPTAFLNTFHNLLFSSTLTSTPVPWNSLRFLPSPYTSWSFTSPHF